MSNDYILLAGSAALAIWFLIVIHLNKKAQSEMEVKRDVETLHESIKYKVTAAMPKKNKKIIRNYEEFAAHNLEHGITCACRIKPDGTECKTSKDFEKAGCKYVFVDGTIAILTYEVFEQYPNMPAPRWHGL